MNEAALRCTDSFLLYDAEYYLAVLDQHAVVENRVRGGLVRGSVDIDAPWDRHTKHLFASPKRLRLDNSGSRDSPIPLWNPKQDVLHLVPVQEAVSKGELADSAEGVLDDTHNRLIGLRRYNLLCGLAKPY